MKPQWHDLASLSKPPYALEYIQYLNAVVVPEEPNAVVNDKEMKREEERLLRYAAQLKGAAPVGSLVNPAASGPSVPATAAGGGGSNTADAEGEDPVPGTADALWGVALPSVPLENVSMGGSSGAGPSR